MKKNILLTEQQLDDLLKNIFGSLGDDKSDKTEKDGGILSSLFGGLGKKSSDDSKDIEKTTKSKTTTKPSAKMSSSDFDEMVKKVIDNLEGGYYHPDMLKDGRVKDGRYGKSGETMFGIDRKHGSYLEKTSEGSEFWKVIDDNKADFDDSSGKVVTWGHGYDGGELKSRLLGLVAKMMQRAFEKNMDNNFDDETKKIILSDKGLKFNFYYATWNGSGYFRDFASKIKSAIKRGVTSPMELRKVAIDERRQSKVGRSSGKMASLLGV